MSDIYNTSAAKACLAAVGALFLISGFTKAIDAAHFAAVISSYGFPSLQFLSPVIIIAEVLLGMALLCRIKPIWAAWAGIALTAGFTAAYIYGLTVHHITDCGCFGRAAILNRNPYVVIGKNVVIIALLAYALLASQRGKGVANAVPGGREARWTALLCIVVMTGTAYSAGVTYRVERTYGHKLNIPLARSPLSELVELSPDSTYFVFAFSYTCPHCMNSVANLRDIAASGSVDHVIGLALGNEYMAEDFTERFRPNFRVITLGKEIFELTENFPHGYLVRGDTIRMETRGELPCELIFSDVISGY